MAEPGRPALRGGAAALGRTLSRRRGERGQVLVFLALLIPLVLLPVAGYAVEAGYAASRAALLEWACTRGAEDAAQVIDEAALRAGQGLGLDAVAAPARARNETVALDPQAVVDSVVVSGIEVTATAHEDVPTTFAFWIPGGRLRVTATATARLAAGYSSPSSALPLATSSLAVTSGVSSSAPSSSRQREGWMNG